MTAENKPGDDATPLRIAGAWLQALTDGSKEVVALLDEDGSVQYLSVSGAVQALLGYEALDIMGMKPGDLVHPLDIGRVMDGFRAVAAHPGGRINIEFRARHRAGHYVRVEATAVNRLRNAWVNAIVVHLREVHQSDGEAPAPSSTRLPPRLEDEEGLLREIDEAIERANAGTYKFSVMLLELERTESLIQAYGKDVARAVLAEVARRLAALLRPGDILAKLQNDAFVILLDGVDDRALASRIALRIQKTVGNRFTVKGQDVLTGAVVGIATSARRYDRSADVLRDASVAVAQARGEEEGHEKRAVYSTRMHVQKTRHMSLMAELHGALQKNQFQVHYMPIVGMATRTMVGFEALARWHHPERGVISPELFIPVAEETGLIVRLGRWVLLEACRQMVDWQKRYELDPPLSLHVNLSGRQFAEFDLDEQVAQILEDTGHEAERLVLEVNERAMLEHREAIAETIRRLRKTGVKFCLDNFGTGASSLTNLRKISYDRLSIDRSLIRQMGGDESARDMVEAIVGLAHSLSMEVVAEGVEAPGQAAVLSKLWCEYAQGYLFGKPIEADAAGALIASYPRWFS